ncbi:MAG: phospholipid carrier-dependent glycosyltransferase [Acidobacteria bacterium]|nr:MAG: phospholipid carrier-dependent glycosyltransferase [Acidobacteriota bacterium]
MKPSGTKTLLALLGVLLVAAGLRIWALDYGLPHPLSRPDEERIVGRAQTIFASGDWHPGSFYYPSLVFYVDTAVLYGYYAVKKTMGDYDRPFDLLFDIAVTRPGLHYLLGRWVGAVSGILTVLVVYGLGRSAYGRAVGLLAAALLATCHLHVRESHFATVDIVMTLFITVSLLFAVRATSKPSIGNYLLAGLFAGLAVSTKYNAGLVVLGLVAASFYALPSLDKKRVAVRLFSAGLIAFLAFAATSPYVLLHYQGFLANMDRLGSFLYGGQGERALWDHLRTTFPAGLGWPLFLVSTAGVARAFWHRRPADWVLLAFLIPCFILISDVRVTFPRYVLPLVPVLVVLAADTAVSVVDRFAAGKRWAWVLALVLLASPGVTRSIRYDRVASLEDTRLLAAEWIGENVAPQTTILLCKGYGAPHVNEDRRRPPAFVVEEVDCSSEIDDRASGGLYLVTHEHEQLTGFSSLDERWRDWLKENASLQISFDPYRHDSEVTPVFYPADAFYIPFDGYAGVERGGPLIGIWKIGEH